MSSITTDDLHGHDDAHEHPSWLSHHFETAEQQYDSGKLGTWLFLVTEVLFFSGMFCAYALYRSLHPEVFVFASEFLNKFLGAINTGVLLFSSLTMAWAVRSAQLSQHRTTIGMLAATLSCAAIFLGVKSVEYSHKWKLNLLPAGMYESQGVGQESDIDFLFYLSIPAAIILVLSAAWYGWTLVERSVVSRSVAGPVFCAAVCYFAGVGLGYYLTSLEHDDAAHSESGFMAHEAGQHAGGHGEEMNASVEENSHSLIAPEVSQGTVAASATPYAMDAAEMEKADARSLPTMYASQSFSSQVATDAATADIPNGQVNQKSKAGIFFSIYYAMTGVHAIHILGGMGVIVWMIVKAARHEFHSQYFGPIDNVGLYWHLVDFIWIYLFPLLYLIT